jgi:hypothetical protein
VSTLVSLTTGSLISPISGSGLDGKSGAAGGTTLSPPSALVPLSEVLSVLGVLGLPLSSSPPPPGASRSPSSEIEYFDFFFFGFSSGFVSFSSPPISGFSSLVGSSASSSVIEYFLRFISRASSSFSFSVFFLPLS